MVVTPVKEIERVELVELDTKQDPLLNAANSFERIKKGVNEILRSMKLQPLAPVVPISKSSKRSAINRKLALIKV